MLVNEISVFWVYFPFTGKYFKTILSSSWLAEHFLTIDKNQQTDDRRFSKWFSFFPVTLQMRSLFLSDTAPHLRRIETSTTVLQKHKFHMIQILPTASTEVLHKPSSNWSLIIQSVCHSPTLRRGSRHSQLTNSHGFQTGITDSTKMNGISWTKTQCLVQAL